MSAKTICYTDRWKNSLSVRVTNTNDQTMETNDENQELPKGSICSASVDLIHDAEHAISSYIALAPKCHFIYNSNTWKYLNFTRSSASIVASCAVETLIPLSCHN